MRHLTAAELSAALDGSPPGGEAAGHLEACAECRAALAELEGQDRALRAALSHDPGEAYFASFPARVESRLGAAADPSARRGRRRGLLEWLADPARAAWAGAAAALVVAVGLLAVLARDWRPESGAPRIRERADQVAETPAPLRSVPAPGASAPAPSASPPASPARPAPPGPAPPGPADALDAERDAVEEGVSGIVMVGPGAPAERPKALDRAAPGRAIRVRDDGRGGEERASRDELPFAPPPGPAPSAQGGEARYSKPGPLPLAGDTEGGRATGPAAALLPEPEARSLGTKTEPRGDRVCGRVRDESGRPVPRAEVVIADLGLAATTDSAGRYCIAAPAGERTLAVMAVGFTVHRAPVRVAGEVTADVTLRAVPVLEGPAWTSRAPREGLTSWPSGVRESARDAERLAAEAERRRSAPLYDRAARSWERVVEGAGEERTRLEARSRAADARYRAWEIEPNAQRAAAAAAALSAYLERAPHGGARDEAARRLDRVRR